MIRLRKSRNSEPFLQMEIMNLLGSGYEFGDMEELKKLLRGSFINDTENTGTVTKRRWKWQKLTL